MTITKGIHLLRKGIAPNPRNIFKRIFFDHLKDEFLQTITNGQAIDGRHVAVINNSAVAKMFKVILFDEAMRQSQLNPDDPAAVRTFKKSEGYNAILIEMLKRLERASQGETGERIRADAFRIYSEVFNAYMSGGEAREHKKATLNQRVQQRIGEMRQHAPQGFGRPITFNAPPQAQPQGEPIVIGDAEDIED